MRKPDVVMKTVDGGLGLYWIEIILQTDYEGEPRRYAVLISCLEDPEGRRASTVLPFEGSDIQKSFTTEAEANYAMRLVNGYFRSKGELDTPGEA